MKPREYRLLERCLEEGLQRGLRRAYKHSESPSEDTILEALYVDVMGEIHQYFTFPQDEDVT